jgi:methyl-accepting chemotaxis protein
MLLGAVAFISLLGSATYLGYGTVERLTMAFESRLMAVERNARLARDVEIALLRQIEGVSRYVETGDPSSRRQFEESSRLTDDLLSSHAAIADLSEEELAAIISLDHARRAAESEYFAARELRTADRAEDASARLREAAPLTAALRAEAADLALLPASRLGLAAAELRAQGDAARRWMLAVFLVSGVLATWLLFTAVRAVNAPLIQLGAAARRMSEGDLRVELNGPMLHEFDVLASNFNTMTGRLRGFVQETITISEYVATSAQDLTAISEQVATSSSEVAGAMYEITRAAEGQSRGLAETCGLLDEMRRRGSRIDEAAHEVVEFSEGIRELAESNRDHLADAIRQIFDLREVVENSEAEARELANASLKIDRFVEMISTVARQTNLLALNAAIEAARAGEHGRGFAVVAEEVRKLADGSAEAARDVAGIVQEVRSKVDRMVETMERGARQVGEVEDVARGAEGALDQIMGSVGGVRDATIEVNDALFANREALRRVEAALSEVAIAAASHAAGAVQVSAAAEEQSAATEEVSAASTQLLDTAGRMRELVSGLKT